MAQLVERVLGKDEVPGSNPGSSSRNSTCFAAGAFLFCFPFELERRGYVKNKAGRFILRVLCVLGVTVLMVLVFLLAGIFVITRGPSPTAGKLFALSVRETSAVKFLANIYYSQEEIDSFYVTNVSDDRTDTSLINIPEKIKDPEYDHPSSESGQQEHGGGTGEDERKDFEIVDIRGKTFYGKMMIVSDPSRVIVGVPDSYGSGSKGLTVMQMIEKYDAYAGINAGGFEDANGQGTGGIPDGMVIIDGEIKWTNLGPDYAYDIVGFDFDNILHVGRMNASEAKAAKIRDAVTFGPALIINGNPCNSTHSLGGGLNPRTAIGQRADGAVLLLVLNGRQIDSLGSTYDDLVDIMLEYGAVNASNLDGGSSSIMVCDGEYLTNSAYIFGERIIATSFLVLKEEDGHAD